MRLGKPLSQENGWKLLEDLDGGYVVLSSCGTFGGWTKDKKAAETILYEKSGAIEKTYPPVKTGDVKVVLGEKVQGRRLDKFYYNKKLIGQVQIGGNPQVIVTKVKNRSCSGYDLGWMLKENKLRLAAS